MSREQAERSACVPLEIGGERLLLTPSGGAWWPDRSILLVSDLHLGKGEAFRAGGMPMTGTVLRGVLAETIDRLDAVLAQTQAERVIVVGDLLHAPAGVTDDLLEIVGAWAARFRGSFELVPGNHDKRIERVASAWGLVVHAEEIAEGGLTLRHYPLDLAPGKGQSCAHVCGHLHPSVSLRDGGGHLRLPAYWVRESAAGVRSLVLPAFTRFAAGKPIHPAAGDLLYGCAPGRVVTIPNRLGSTRP